LQGYRTGRGIVQMRARVFVETQKKSERQSIVVTEIPYQVNKANLITKIAELVREKKLEGISDIRDESDRDGMRIVIETEARRRAADHPQPPLQADSDAVFVRHQHAGNRRRPAEGADAARRYRPLHRPPTRDRYPAHHLRAKKSRGPRPYFWRG